MHPKVYAAAAIMITKYAAFSLKDVEQFVGGLFMGFVNKDDLSNIQTCLKDAQTIDEELTAAIQDFEKKDLEDIIKGIQEIAQIIPQLNTDLGDCKGMEADVARVEKWAAIFKDRMVWNPAAEQPGDLVITQ